MKTTIAFIGLLIGLTSLGHAQAQFPEFDCDEVVGGKKLLIYGKLLTDGSLEVTIKDETDLTYASDVASKVTNNEIDGLEISVITLPYAQITLVYDGYHSDMTAHVHLRQSNRGVYKKYEKVFDLFDLNVTSFGCVLE